MTDTPPAADSPAVRAGAGSPPADSPAVRDRIVDALRLDLVGPPAGHVLVAERLPGWVRPSNWYLTGFLVPSGMPPERCADADEDDDFETEVCGACTIRVTAVWRGPASASSCAIRFAC